MNELLESRTEQALEKPSLQDCLRESLRSYFSELGDAPACDVHAMVMQRIEEPMLVETLRHVRGNQSKAAIVLGLSRGTLRKKLKIYGMEGRIKEVIAE